MRGLGVFKAVTASLRDSHGTSTLELAFVFPIGMLLLLGAVDSSLGFAEKLRAEAAAARAIEQITSYSRVNTDYSSSRAEAAAAANVAVSDVTITYWLECNAVVQSNFTASCPNNSDQIARYVKVTIRGKYEPIMNYGSFLTTDAGGFVRVEGDASVRIQ
jgi:Flp pilus assembly protein TadG